MDRTYIIGYNLPQPGGYRAFIPADFPPRDGYQFDPATIHLAFEATRQLSRLDGGAQLLPDLDFFLMMYLRKDATASSQIEGTRATMMDAIEAEVRTPEEMPSDVDDILHYIKALRYGMDRIRNFPVSLRFISELHKELMQGARASHYAAPGEFRTSQNWLDGTRPDNARFVPPPVDDMKTALGQLEKFFHAKDMIPPIIKAGLIHAQFETIHPFLDGNGRTGRMLITFYLCQQGYLEQPVLYLSSYFKKHREVYLTRLEDYHNGHVDRWLTFFLDGIIEISSEASVTIKKITDLRMRNLQEIQKLGKRAVESALPVLNRLYNQPIVSTSTICEWTGFSIPGAQKVINRFLDLGILALQDDEKKYGQLYQFAKYLSIFAE